MEVQTIKWSYKGEILEEVPSIFDTFHSVVYRIDYEGGFFYYGKKKLQSESTIPALKSGVVREGYERITKRVLRDEEGKIVVSKANIKKARARGLKATNEPYDRITVNSKSFLSYEGSSDFTDGAIITSKEILLLCLTEKDATYQEMRYIIKADGLEDPLCFNGNILGRFFANKEN